MKLGARLATLLGLALVAACSPQSGSDTSSGTPRISSLQGGSILDGMRTAPDATCYSGTRRLWMRFQEDGVPSILEYEETVYADGAGGFAIEPGPVTAPPMTQAQRDLFEILQRVREGFLFRYRDFRVRDTALLQQNYRVVDTGATPSVAGRPCDELRFEATRGVPHQYVVAIDHDTRLVLRCEERDERGQPVARMEFTSFDPAPLPANVTMHVDAPAASIDVAADNRAVLGFALRKPRVTFGHPIAHAERVEAEGRTYARLVYDDGIEPLFYLYSGVAASGGMAAPALDRSIDGAAIIRVFQAGPWTVAQCNRQGAVYVVVGRLDEARIVQMLQSAVE